MGVMPQVAQEPWQWAKREADIGNGLYELFLKQEHAKEMQGQAHAQQIELDRRRDGQQVDRQTAQNVFQREQSEASRNFQREIYENYGAPNSQTRRANTGRGAISPESKKIRSQLIKDLVAEAGLTKEQADGMVGEFMAESGDFRSLQELKPLVPGSRGGFGYAQHTGARRVALEQYAKENGLDPGSYAANKGYIVKELLSPEYSGYLEDLRKLQNPFDAATLTRRRYLRPLSTQPGQPWDVQRDARVRSRIGIPDDAPVQQAAAEQSSGEPAVATGPSEPSSQQQPASAQAAPAAAPKPAAQASTGAAGGVVKVIGPDGKPRYVLKSNG